MQIELLNRKKCKTRVELAIAIFEYIEIFHNRQRRHSALGYRTPIEYDHVDEEPAHTRSAQTSATNGFLCTSTARRAGAKYR